MKSSHLITIALIAFICITGINGQARGRPVATSSGSSRMPTRNTAASQPTQASTPSAPVSSAGNHNQEPETFSVADLAGTHALKASGVVLVGGVGSPIVVSGSSYQTYPESLWISLEGRLCITEKGECALNAWVNVGGHTSIHLDTANPASTVPSGQACKVNVDEFGQGVAYVPVVLSADEGAMTSLPNFPSFIVIKFQAYDGGHSYFEIEGCGPAGTIVYSGTTYGLPGYAGSSSTQSLLQYIQHVCTPSNVQEQGRRPISLTGESSRISFRCSNCKKDDFAWYGSDCNDICPWDSSSGHNSHGGGPRVGRNNGGSTSDSLDN